MAWDFDIFLSNAAIGDSGPMAEIPVELVRRTFQTNVFANLDIIQHVIRKWVDAGKRRRLFITSSMGGLGTYCATKHALEGIAATLRDELAPHRLTVQTINPGGLGGGGQRAEPCLLSEIGSEPARAFNRASRASGFEEALTWEVGT
jgi:NAD(P)-dependent dehydrogenase (short-subunit alcohol dehydrogenase family)